MCGPGPLLGPMLTVWGRSWDLCWRSWASLAGPGPLLGPMWAVLAALGRLLEPMLTIFDCSSASTGGPSPLLGPPCWQSWAALGAYVGGLGLKNAKSMPTLEMYVFLARERDLRPGG